MSALRFGGAWVAFGVATVLPLHAELHWLQPRVVVEPAAGAPVAVGLFQCVNRGEAPVRIAAVQSGCGCTAAALEHDTIAPGGTGAVQATFTAGDRQGTQTVALTVTTQEPHERTYDLVLEVRLKPFAAVAPLGHAWRLGEPVSAQRFRVALANGFEFVAAETDSRDFAAAVVERAANAVVVQVTPRDLFAKRAGNLRIKVAQPGRTPVEIAAWLRIL